MFSFFKRQKVSINSVTIPNFGWTKTDDTKSKIQWINPEQTVAISVNFFNLQPDIPTIKLIDTLRNFYRNSITSINGGLIEVELKKIANIPVARTIFKIPQEPSGMTYIASLTIPFETCSFVLKVQGFEDGITGMRDTMVANKLLGKGDLTIGENGYENWFSDPYDSNFTDGTLMNKSEQTIYDKDFPSHPLTLVRTIINKIESELTFNSDVEKLGTLTK